ncbi:RNA recognition motif-containing protein 21 [Elsinoe australis]|uniref:RNA recognition motif-containing protein 21 n=1 Tax=Elsinoe australis TaxID=40998 RepID=A0A4U7AYS6_9PEZI|nr:RNA recognition motif-containing protein 21 [Elsinoe australis]
MSRGGGTTLYVTGFGHGTRARDLAYEFERYGRLVRCDIPAPRTASSRLFAFVEYENRRDADDAYYEMHNFRFSRDETLKVEWARTPPSASWRFDAGAGPRPSGGRRSPRRRSASPPRRGGGRGSYSPRKEDRRERDYDRRDRDRDRDRDRSRSPDDRDREMKDVRDSREDDREQDPEPESATNGDERKAEVDDLPPAATHDDLDTAE